MDISTYTEVDSIIRSSGREDLTGWIDTHLPELKQQLTANGVVILRGFHAVDDNICESVLRQVGNEILEDAFWSTPRKQVSGKTFTATEMTANRTIPLHSEMTYMTAWPRLLAFHSLTVPDEGGTTTVCDLAAVSQDLGDLLVPFREHGVIYQRTHRPGVDVPWKVAYRTTDPADVEKVAERIGMQVEWLPKDILRTRHKAQGTIETETGETLWFNQSNLFHPAALPAEARKQMTALFGADGLPRNAFYGDGSVIPDDVIIKVNQAFERHTKGANWQQGDVMIVDNMRYAHGRAPFRGERKLHVAMANKYDAPRRTPLFAVEAG